MRNKLAIIILVVFVIGLAGCAKDAGRPPHKRFPPTGRETPKDVVRPAETQRTEIITPQRQASLRLVERGKQQLEVAHLDLAATTFRDAVSVDSTNGVAYYHLAVTQAKLDQPDVALGLLDKAESLLMHDREWVGRINELREELGAPTTTAVPLEIDPVDEAF